MPARYQNMDLMRYLLALSVLLAHFSDITGLDKVPYPISSYDAVGCFFALSGFLMYPNYLRHGSLRHYTFHRFMRIVPPYFLVVTGATLLLCVASTLPAAAYFTSPDTWKYFAANICTLNWLHPSLPGVFQGPEYHIDAVNGSLWTIKVEWALYFTVPLFVWILSKIKVRKSTLAVAVILLSVAYRMIFIWLYDSTGQEIYKILSRQFFGQLSYFYCGMCVSFVLPWFLRHRWPLLLGALLLYLPLHTHPLLHIAVNPLTLTIITMALSLGSSRRLRPLWSPVNISYQIYLFHFPVIQCAVWLGLTRSLPPMVCLAVCVAVTTLLSLASYFGVERPLQRKFLQV